MVILHAKQWPYQWRQCREQIKCNDPENLTVDIRLDVAGTETKRPPEHPFLGHFRTRSKACSVQTFHTVLRDLCD